LSVIGHPKRTVQQIIWPMRVWCRVPICAQPLTRG
jgi:hypothetical protein